MARLTMWKCDTCGYLYVEPNPRAYEHVLDENGEKVVLNKRGDQLMEQHWIEPSKDRHPGKCNVDPLRRPGEQPCYGTFRWHTKPDSDKDMTMKEREEASARRGNTYVTPKTFLSKSQQRRLALTEGYARTLNGGSDE